MASRELEIARSTAPSAKRRAQRRGDLIPYGPLRIRLAGLALLASLSVLAAPAAANDEPASAPSVADRERSRAAFRRGVTQLRAQDWAGSRTSFEEAYGLVPHPSILLNLGIARLRTDEPVLAEQDLARFVSDDSGASPEELTSARQALVEARERIGTLRVLATPAYARVLVDGKMAPIRATPPDGGLAEARVRAGTHAITVQAEGYLPEERSADVVAKTDTDVRFTLVPRPAFVASKPEEPSSTSTRTIVGWTFAGISAASLVGAGVLGLRAMSLASDYVSRSNASFQDPDVKDEGVTFRTVADVALVTGIVTGSVALVLLLTNVGSPPRPTSALRPSLRW